MRILIWLFFLLITGEAVWAKGPKVLFIGDSITPTFFCPQSLGYESYLW